jgi:predicted RNase H-like nuclease (RuvC/YqgF family)
MKNKERISQLEAENKELRDDLNRQGDLLEKLTKELSELKRSVTPLLPEK